MVLPGIASRSISIFGHPSNHAIPTTLRSGQLVQARQLKALQFIEKSPSDPRLEEAVGAGRRTSYRIIL
jgi:hypothetical protein